MLYLLYGSDTEKARSKMRELRDALSKKKPDAALIRFDSQTFNEHQFDELIGSLGLFESKSIVILDKVFEEKEYKEAVMSRLPLLSSSENIFIVLEGRIDKASLAKLEKKAEKAQVFELQKTAPKKESNFFALADALGARDKKELWVKYRSAIKSGAVPEELHGILFWQVKSMLLAAASPDAKAAGLNPFVFKKAAAFSRNFSHADLSRSSSRLISIYHDAHRGIHDFETALEIFILEL